MLVNVFGGYASTPSIPRSKDVCFYSCERPNFLFQGSDPVRLACQSYQRGLGLEWVLCRNMLTTPLRNGRGEPQLDHTFLIEIGLKRFDPGFYDLHVTIALGGAESVSARTTFGWNAFDEPRVATCPDDFSHFWQQACRKVDTTNLDLSVQLKETLTGDQIGRYNIMHAALPESYDPEGEKHTAIELYNVDFASPTGGRVYASFAKPAGYGSFPSLLVLPGAGNTRRPAPIEHARHGYAALDIQVHGYEVDAQMYPSLPDLTYTSPDEYLHYRAYLNALQAVRALQQLPSADPDRMAAIGGSQGGRLATVVAALDPRIRAVVPAVTHFGYVPWTRWVGKMNAERSAAEKPFSAGDVVNDDQTRVESYFDVVNFAGYVQCPALMNAGLIDPVSPPTAVYQIYRQFMAAKEIVPLPNTAHDWCPVFDRYAWRWMAETLYGLPQGHAVTDSKDDQYTPASNWRGEHRELPLEFRHSDS